MIAAECRHYKARGAALALWRDRSPEILLSGPAGCIAPETRIYDPITGESPTVADLHASGLAPVVLTMWGPAQADVPFIKGVADLYRIRTESGRECLVTADHLIFTPDGWRHSGDLVPGQILLSAGPVLPPTIPASCPPASPRDARHSTRTVPGCPDDCSPDRRRNDGRLRRVGAADLTSPPSPADALGLAHDGWPRDDRAGTTGYTPTCPSCDLPSMPGYPGRLGGMASARSCGRPETSSRDVCSSRAAGPSPIATTLRPRVDGRGRGRDSTLHPWPSSASSRHVGWHAGLAGATRLLPPRSPGLPSAYDGVPGPVLAALSSGACIPSFGPPKLHYRGQWDRITSVTYERTGEYYDLAVPGPAHYFAEGFWHHNTGKSRGNLEKLNACALKWPGMRGLIVRKTRESLTESALVTFESNVLPAGSPIASGAQRAARKSYVYPNGSEIIVGGLLQAGKDQKQKIMSTEYDVIYAMEAIELTEHDWENLTTRLRNGVMPFQQLLADTNPDAPTHWLKRRCDDGNAAMLESRHEDNPRLWDAARGAWTPYGIDYLARLDRLTGVRKQRLRHGRWVSAEGVVYEGWDRSIHLIDRPLAEIRRYVVAVDWGYSGPGVLAVYGIDGDGRMYLVEEHYRTKRLIGWWVDLATRIDERYRPEAFACDPAEPGFIREFTDAGLPAIKAYNDIKPGIQAVAARLADAGDGRRRFYVLHDAMTDRDEDLVEAKKPTCLAEEMDAYMWPKGVDGKAVKELPVDDNNHACLVAGTMVETSAGPVAIECIRSGDMVLTRDGYRPVIGAGMTEANAPLWEASFSDGTSLIGTANHPVYVREKGFIALDTLRYADTIEVAKRRPHLCRAMWRSSSITASNSVATRTRSAGQIGSISSPITGPAKAASVASTRRFGRTPTAPSPTGTTSIIATATRSTTPSKTWSASPRPSTPRGIPRSHRNALPGCGPRWMRSDRLLVPGIPRPRAGNGIAGMAVPCGSIASPRRIAANGAANPTCLATRRPTVVSVRTNARRRRGGHPGWTTRIVRASNAARLSGPIVIPRCDAAGGHVLGVRPLGRCGPVFNLTVAGKPEYFANGVLVHNCDALRYAVAYVDNLGSRISDGPLSF